MMMYPAATLSARLVIWEMRTSWPDAMDLIGTLVCGALSGFEHEYSPVYVRMQFSLSESSISLNFDQNYIKNTDIPDAKLVLLD
jgi:hypothetical protein